MVSFGNTPTRKLNLLFQPVPFLDLSIGFFLKAVIDGYSRLVFQHLHCEENKQDCNLSFYARLARVAPDKPSVLMKIETGLRSSKSSWKSFYDKSSWVRVLENKIFHQRNTLLLLPPPGRRYRQNIALSLFLENFRHKWSRKKVHDIGTTRKWRRNSPIACWSTCLRI